jgi:TonB family protein
LVGLALATVAVGYAAVGERIDLRRFLGLRTAQRLPALRSGDLPFRYPAVLWQEGIEGEVLLRIHITEAGTVDSVELEQSSGHAVLDTVALKGARQLEYHPALQGEQTVAVWAQLPVRFQRQSPEVTRESN